MEQLSRNKALKVDLEIFNNCYLSVIWFFLSGLG